MEYFKLSTTVIGAALLLGGCGSESTGAVDSDAEFDTALVSTQAAGTGADAAPDAGDDTNDTEQRNPSWRFAVVGDTHITAMSSEIPTEIVASILSDEVDLVIVVGDLVEGGSGVDVTRYENQLRAFKDALMVPLRAAGIEVYVMRGNHEADVPDGSSAWRAAFGGEDAMPSNGPQGEVGMTYSFTHRNALFIALDNYAALHSVNQEWLDTQLQENTTSPHLFVFGHEPAFRIKHADCLGVEPAARNAFWASLAAAGARTYFCGHDHFFDAARIDDGDGDPNNDIFQLLVGAGGGELHDLAQASGDNAPFTPIPVFHGMEFGYLLVEVGDSGRADFDVSLTFRQRALPESTIDHAYPATWEMTAF